MVRGYYDTLRLATVPLDLGQGIYFEQEWGSRPGTMPVASGGIHAGQITSCWIPGEDVVLQFGGGTSATRWASRPAPPPTGSRSRP